MWRGSIFSIASKGEIIFQQRDFWVNQYEFLSNIIGKRYILMRSVILIFFTNCVIWLLVKLIVYIGNSYINIGTMRIAIARNYIGIFDVLVIFNKILVSMYITLVIMNILLAIINNKEKND